MPGRRRSRRAPVARAWLRALLAAGLAAGLASPATAAERIVTVTAEGVQPQVLTAAPGDTVRFVVEDGTFAYRAQSTGGGWSFDSGPVELLSGAYEVPSALTAPGTYTYRVAQDPPYQGTVVVTEGGVAASPPATSPGGAGEPVPSPPAPSTPVPGATPVPVPPPDGATPSAVPPAAGADAPRSGGPVTLAQPSEVRRLGLPAALALVLVLGAGSLLLRALLAEPVLSAPGARLRSAEGPRSRW